MAKEALLGAFKGRTGGGFGLPVQRPLAAGDVGGFHRRVQVPMNDSLSRGSDNAQERGIVAEFLHCRAILLHIILIANLGGLWTS
ncbi:hypothetical protein CAF53_01215 [Sphingobium sp. LB126]|nr:hypothetical protein CAF53_01215 [Sphingobium sp. LB126]